MSYTRRSLIKDAAMLAMAAPAAGAFGQTKRPKAAVAARFPVSGIRIFFSGAWLFGPDFDSSGNLVKTSMRAITLNPGELGNSLLHHIFPHGAWDATGESGQPGDWDHQPGRKNLPTTYNASNPTLVTPHTITVTGPGSTSSSPVAWKSPFTNVGDLFNDANTKSRFFYITDSSQYAFSITPTSPGVRVISLPIPTRIIPSGFRQGVSIYDPHNHMAPANSSLPNNNNTNDVSGLPTTHIFEYKNATSMTFTPLTGTPYPVVMADTSLAADFHFHAVPTNSYSGHDVDMFNALFRLVEVQRKTSAAPMYSPDIYLDPSNSLMCITLGDILGSTGVSNNELEIAALCPAGEAKMYTLTLATCCSGGYGVCGCN